MNMKTNSLLIPAVAILFAGFVSLGTAQPARLDPATGMPMPGGPGGAPAMDPAFQAMQDRQKSIDQVHKLIASGDYDEALKECLVFQSQLKGDQTLEPLIADWVELGRRFPAAKDELIKIRDHDVGEFSAGRGYAVLFSEIKSINGWLNEDDATETLFKSIRQQDPKLGGQCYGAVEDLLIQKGEYALCLECIGDPRVHFDGILSGFQMQVATQQHQIEMQRYMDSMPFHHAGPPPFAGFDQGKMATNNFVAQVVTLEKILSGAGRQADAEIIRDQALATVEDDRIRTATKDIEPKAQK